MPPDTMALRGAVAEWLGRGLQSLAHQFDSGRRLFGGMAYGSVIDAARRCASAGAKAAAQTMTAELKAIQK